MDRLQSMRVFQRVVDQGGCVAAARSLDLITKVGLPAGAVLALTPVWIEFGALNAAAALLIAMIAGFGFLVMMER